MNSNKRIWSDEYWRSRARTMCEGMIEKKIEKSECSRQFAEAAFKKWLVDQTKVELVNYDLLNVRQCRVIVAFLHRHSL